MTNGITLRLATSEDYAFALRLYLSTTRPYAEELMTWDEHKQVASFAEQWKLEDVRVIGVDGLDVGWFQARESSSEILLQQLFIAPGHQRAGIGTAVFRALLAGWTTSGKPVVLTVLKNNPARRLYERLGFSVVGEAGVKFAMKRDP
jgi:ribosomal protein S18 acetylase RimI-like enzyme